MQQDSDLNQEPSPPAQSTTDSSKSDSTPVTAANATGMSKAAKKRNRKKNKAAQKQSSASGNAEEKEETESAADASETQESDVTPAADSAQDTPIAAPVQESALEQPPSDLSVPETPQDADASDDEAFEDTNEHLSSVNQDHTTSKSVSERVDEPSISSKAEPLAELQSADDTNLSLPSRKYIPMALDSAPGTGSSGIDASSMIPSLLEARSAEISVTFDAKDPSQQSAINQGVESIKKTFREIKSTMGHLPAGLLGGEEIQWDLWTRVVDDYYNVVHNEPDELQRATAGGIPKEIRGIIWQLVARSKDPQLEELYMHLKTEPSVHERAIKRDLTRTSFYTNVEAIDKATELYNVISAYSNFDPDVGYTQGMAFIAIPLVMNTTESECFCLLVALMKEYGLRELFCPDMRGLHLLLHQFDRLLELHSPLLYNHLVRQGVKSSMYASQWFLTFFGYKFPLEVVLRIFDMIITQGMEVILKLALNLMLRNERTLLRLSFDSLLDYLKSSLFNVYVKDELVKSGSQEASKRFSLLVRKPSAKSTDYYNLDLFIQDSLSIDVSPLDLKRYKIEFDQIVSKDFDREAEIEDIRDQNGKLRHEIKILESELYSLNQDHMNLVESLVDTKVSLPELTADNEELREKVAGLESDIHDLESKLGLSKADIPEGIEAQIGDLLQQNAAETERFASLEEELSQLTLEHDRLRAELNANKKWFWKS